MGVLLIVGDFLLRRRNPTPQKAAAEGGAADRPLESDGTTPDAAPAFNLPELPSIAVLPFSNMSDDAAQDYFADGMVEDIISGLSRVKRLFVIARNSVSPTKANPSM